MAVSRLRKKKIYILISRLATICDALLDDSDDTGECGQALELLPALVPQFEAESEASWSEAEEDAYLAAEAMSDALDPEAPEQPDMPALLDNLETAIAALNA